MFWSINEPEVAFFHDNGVLYSYMLAGAYKKFEGVQHTEIHLLGIKVQYKLKIKLPLDMVSKHALLYL